MKTTIYQEGITTVKQFKGYVRSFRFFKFPVFLLFASVGGVVLTILGIETVLSGANFMTKIFFGFLSLCSFVFIACSIWVTYAHIKDAIQLRVKVRTVELEKINIHNNKVITYYLVYNYQQKVRSVQIPDNWVEKLTSKLPCQAVLYTTYHAGKVLMVELTENGETFPVV